jgi:hypothetical protein
MVHLDEGRESGCKDIDLFEVLTGVHQQYIHFELALGPRCRGSVQLKQNPAPQRFDGSNVYV